MYFTPRKTQRTTSASNLNLDLQCFDVSLQEFAMLYQTRQSIRAWPWLTGDSVLKCQVDYHIFATLFQQEPHTGRVTPFDELRGNINNIKESDGIVSFVHLIDPPITIDCYTPRNLEIFHLRSVNGALFFLRDEVSRVEFKTPEHIPMDGFTACRETKEWFVDPEIPEGEWKDISEHLSDPFGVPPHEWTKIDRSLPIVMVTVGFYENY
jgi:hypothetical protein